MNSPSILLGYEAQGMASHFGSIVGKTGLQNTTKGHGTPFSNQKSAFITIFLTLQPSVTPAPCFKVNVIKTCYCMNKFETVNMNGEVVIH